nr:MAG TPA: hypothetical protein [Caudoviricetes sp.]
MALIKCYYVSISKRLIDSYIFLPKGITPFMAMKGSIISLILKMVSSPNFLLRWFDSSRRL